ncbi:MAG: hypothetical protein KGI05_00725 [Thaumarchaeota archaeon]|nr:hypothetical protein [Nitrososphaerota archaeon]
MKIAHLACRVYRLEPRLEREIKSLLLRSKKDEPLFYDKYRLPNGKDLELSIEIKQRTKNAFGHEITIWVDKTDRLPDRENNEQVVRYYQEHKVHLFENTKNFSEHIVVFGPKVVDTSLIKAIKHKVKTGKDRVPDPFILVKVDFKAMEKLIKEFPNLQHFCIRDIPDERTKGVIVKGNMLEETDLFERFVMDADTKGPVNFLGITTDFGKLVYLGKDGSLYSRMSFAKEDTIKIIYGIYERLKKIGVLSKKLDDF